MTRHADGTPQKAAGRHRAHRRAPLPPPFRSCACPNSQPNSPRSSTPPPPPTTPGTCAIRLTRDACVDGRSRLPLLRARAPVGVASHSKTNPVGTGWGPSGSWTRRVGYAVSTTDCRDLGANARLGPALRTRPVASSRGEHPRHPPSHQGRRTEARHADPMVPRRFHRRHGGSAPSVRLSAGSTRGLDANGDTVWTVSTSNPAKARPGDGGAVLIEAAR